MTPEDWSRVATAGVSLVGVVATTALALATIRAGRRRDEAQRDREERWRREQLEREDAFRTRQREREDEIRADQRAREDALRSEQLLREDDLRRAQRGLVPRVTYDIECVFHGPQETAWVADIRLVVDNKGAARRAFRRMRLRMRTIDRDVELALWDQSSKLRFDRKVLDVELIDEGRGEYYYVEPGVRQIFSYPTLVSTHVSYALIHARFFARREAEEPASPDDQFDEERLFALPVLPASDVGTRPS